MSHSIAGRIRALERKLARPLARVKAMPHVNRLLDGWRAAYEHKSRLPDPFRFMSRLIRSGVHPPGDVRATGYLERCRAEGVFPEHRRLFDLMFTRRATAEGLAHARNGPSP